MKKLSPFVLALVLSVGFTVNGFAQVIAPLDLYCSAVAETRKTGDGHYLLCTNVGRYCPDVPLLNALVECGLVSPEEAYKAFRDKSNAVLALEPTKWTFDVSSSDQSVFVLFGDTASTRPVGTLDFTFERSGLSIEGIFVDGLDSDQNKGDLVRYYDGIFKKKLLKWRGFSATAGVEFFYAPPQLGNASSTFISPLATATWEANDHFALELGVQYVGTHNTDYEGDRLYGWIEATFSHSIKRVSLDVSPGYILADTGRSTIYASGDLTVEITDHFSVYGSYLEARSRGVVGASGVVPIDGTVTVGVNTSF